MIKKYILINILLTMAIQASSIQWTNNYHLARQKAKKEHKSVLLFISSKTNPTCDYMEKDTFENRTVSKQIKDNYVPVRLFIEDDRVPMGIKFFAVPSTYFLNPKGREIRRRIVGEFTPKQLKKILVKIKKPKSKRL